MSKVLIAVRLDNDVAARAGQVLVQLASGQTYAVDAEVYEALVQPAPKARKRRSDAGSTRPRLDTQKRQQAIDMLVAGHTIRHVASQTGVPHGTVATIRAKLAKLGRVPAKASPEVRAKLAANLVKARAGRWDGREAHDPA